MTVTLDDLVTEKTRETVLSELFDVLLEAGFPTSSWHTTSVPRRLLTAMAGVYSDFTTLLRNVTKGGLLLEASGDWLTILADQIYDEQRTQATTAKGICKIRDEVGAGPWSVNAGDLWWGTASGLQFTNTESFTITAGAPGPDISFEVQAEESGAHYNVGQDTIVTLLTPLPGTGYAAGAASYNPDAAWRTTDGADEEEDTSLQTRCQDKWSTLGYGQNSDWYKYQVRNSTAHGITSVSKVKVTTSIAGDGAVTITVAGDSGAIPGGDLATLTAFLQSVKGSTTTLTVQNCINNTIVPVGTIYAYSAYAGGALAKAQTALEGYLASYPIGEVIYLSSIVDALQYSTTEVRNVNLTVPVGNVGLASTECGVLGSFAGMSVVSV